MTSSTKARRTVKVILPIANRPSGVVQITDKGQSSDYHLKRMGEGVYRFRKLEEGAGEAYDVRVGGGAYACGCKGFGYRGQCRHGGALLALARRGLL
jgi:hypothetical protein